LREELVEAAAQMIAATGDARELTLRGVARQIGIAAPSIYRHFPDIQHLKMAVVERAFREFAQERDQAEDDSDDPCDGLLSGCRAYCRFALSNPGVYRFMFGENAPGRTGRSSAGNAALVRLTDSIRRCQESGAARADDPDAAAMQVWATLHGLCSLHLNLPDFGWPAQLEEMATGAVTRLLDLQPQPKTSHPTEREG
jgi:AcrR family transcriptional regulator